MNRQEYFDRLAAEWDGLVEEETLARLKEIVADLEIEPGSSVLDLGCGTGVLFPMLLERVVTNGLALEMPRNGASCETIRQVMHPLANLDDKPSSILKGERMHQKQEGRIVGLDISHEMLRCAQAKGYPVECVQGDAESLPLSDETFDWVICNAVFPHFLGKLRALSEIRRVLREGGRLIICHTESRQAINELHRSIGGVVANDTIPPDEEVQWLLREAGLDKAVVRNEPDRYLVLACRNESRNYQG